MTTGISVCIICDMNGVCLTGNRPHKIPFSERSRECAELKERMRAAVVTLIGEGYKRFYSGMALGADTWFAEIVLDLKDVYPDIELIAAVPYAGQKDRLSASDRFRYDRIIERATDVVVLSPEYTKYCMGKRNRYMVDNSDVVLVVNYAESGGTVNTLAYARKRGKRVVDLTI